MSPNVIVRLFESHVGKKGFENKQFTWAETQVGLWMTQQWKRYYMQLRLYSVLATSRVAVGNAYRWKYFSYSIVLRASAIDSTNERTPFSIWATFSFHWQLGLGENSFVWGIFDVGGKNSAVPSVLPLFLVSSRFSFSWYFSTWSNSHPQMRQQIDYRFITKATPAASREITCTNAVLGNERNPDYMQHLVPQELPTPVQKN